MLAANRVSDRWIAPLVVLIVFVTHLGGFRGFERDSFWYVPTAMSIVREGNTDLDEFGAYAPPDDYAVRRHGGHLYNYYPLGSALFAVPFVWMLDLLAGLAPDSELIAKLLAMPTYALQAVVATAAVALTAGVLYLISRLYLSILGALGAAFILAFCTPAWSTGSRALWQHGPSMLALSVVLYAILLAERRPLWLILAGLALAFAYVIRPTNALSLLFLSLAVLLRHRQRAAAHLLGLGLVFAPFSLYSYRLYGRLVPAYYTGASFRVGRGLLEGLLGTLISPARGLWVYAPIFLLAPVGMALWVKQRPRQVLTYALAATIVLHWIAISGWPMWWGGGSIGPRLLSDLTPYLVFLIIPLLGEMPGLRSRTRTALRAALGLTLLLSLAIQAKCALDQGAHFWNAWPENADRNPARLWDWGDIPTLRGIQVIAPLSAPLPAWNAPFVPNRMQVQFGEAFLLRGYELRWATSSRLSVALYWQARQQPEFDYSAFLHVVDAGGNLVAQKDHPPGARMDYRPVHWRPGDLVYDEHTVELPSGTGGELRLKVGLYDWRTGERLPAWVDGAPVGDEVSLGEPLQLAPIYWDRLYFPLLYRGAPSR